MNPPPHAPSDRRTTAVLMHGRRKAEYANRSEAEKAAQQAKVAKYRQLAALALARRHQEGPNADDPAASLQLAGQLLRVNPDVYTLWNHRKEIIQGAGLLAAASSSSSAQPDEAQQQQVSSAPESTSSSSPSTPTSSVTAALEFLEGELALVAECIQKNPKSYGAWHHRRWLFEKASAPGAGLGGPAGLAALLDRELVLCGKLLDADERNFHCWNYRRFVAGLHPTRTASDELAFSTERIYRNFSNYSAFHHRTAYVPAHLQEAGLDAREWVRRELEVVQQAVFTEPDDQTAWWYHQYLVAVAAQSAAEKGDPAFLQDVLRGEIAAIRGLLEESGGYRWAVLTLAALLRRLAGAVEAEEEEEEEGGRGGGGGEEARALLAESTELYERLVELDPNHARRYQSLLAAPIWRGATGK